MADGNGSPKPSLELLGAPRWYIEGERQHAEDHAALAARVTALEQAMVKGAAWQGKKWGVVAGSVVGTAITIISEYLK